MIDDLCADELEKVGLFPEKPEPIRIERFVEKRFNVSPTYEETPAGVLGFTRFGPKGVSSIIISAALEDETSATAHRRANSTLAHEAGHGLLHAHLFVLAAANDVVSLFEGQVEAGAPRILCRDDQAGSVPAGGTARRYDGRWWEHQANQAIGGLLLPKVLVRDCLGPLLRDGGPFGGKFLDPENRAAAARLIADTFDVNSAVARIRIDNMFPVADDGQLTF